MLRTGIPFQTIPAAGVHGVGWRALPGNVRRLGRGYSISRQILRQFRPEVLFFTGGFVAVPMALAGRRVPSLLYIPDIEPGLALKFLAFTADHLALTVEDTRKYLPARARTTVTGYPTRPGLQKWSKAEAHQLFHLLPDIPVLLVFGGSKGARSINRALFKALPLLLPEVQVIHITGELDWEDAQAERTSLAGRLTDQAAQERYHAFPYLHEEMGAALRAADLVVSRAGASVLGEFPLFGLPAVLVPYPHAWRYQKTNAEFLAGRGAAVIIDDEALQEKFTGEVLGLIRSHDRRRQMSQAMQNLARPSAASLIAEELRHLAGETDPGKGLIR